ncbi:MAG: MBL fold metallo-hydrolase, partial [Candidatus Hecatellales archaeon]
MPHAGIVNIVEKALTVVGVEKVRAVIGGFHLVEASDERVKNTITALRRLGVKEVYTGHCTG